MQKTNFRFVAIVHDDDSTDETANIIREYEEKYPNIIKPIYETENQYSKSDGSLNRIMNTAIDATGAKYVAMCEGDATSQKLDDKGLLRLCRHYESLVANFPKINTDYCHRFISMIYYSKFRKDRGMRNKIRCFFTAFKHYPQYVIYKLLKIKIKERNDSFYKNYHC